MAIPAVRFRFWLLFVSAAGLFGALAPSAPVDAEPGYRTVVVFGDTQSLVDAYGPDHGSGRHDPDDRSQTPRDAQTFLQAKDADEYAAFGEMIGWVIENKERERIDFVLHTGDAIERACRDDDGDPLQQFPPHSCAVHVPFEWERFNAQWKRLDGVVPYAIARGNHDNIGAGVPETFHGDLAGFADHYGAAVFQQLSTRFGADRIGYQQTCPVCRDQPTDDRDSRCCPHPDTHVWTFDLGGQDVQVVAPAYRPTQSARGWIESVLANGLPTILLAHHHLDPIRGTDDPAHFAQGSPAGAPVLWQEFVGSATAEFGSTQPVDPGQGAANGFTDRVFMTVQGHLGGDTKQIVEIEGRRVLSIRFDQQGSFSDTGSLLPKGARMVLLRFYRGGAGPDRVEGRTRALDGTFSAKSHLPLQPFSITRDIDRDGVSDRLDACPAAADPVPLDRDGDGVFDACDSCPDQPNDQSADADADGIGDACDLCPGYYAESNADFDADGVGDACDSCPYIANPAQTRSRQFVQVGCDCLCGDVTGDCLIDNRDRDAALRKPATADLDFCDLDGNGLCDAFDVRHMADLAAGRYRNFPPLTPRACAGYFAAGDRDADGVSDAADNCPWVPNPDQLLMSNALDPQSAYPALGRACGCGDIGGCRDGRVDALDGYEAIVSVESRNDTRAADLAGFCDVTGDGDCSFSDAIEMTRVGRSLPPGPQAVFDQCPGYLGDADADGVYDLIDVCPGLFDPDQADADSDGVGDLCDNCRYAFNPDQDRVLQSEILGTFDEIGCACLCGDVAGPGFTSRDCRIDDADALVVGGFLAGVPGVYMRPGFCDVTGDGICSGDDIDAVRRFALTGDSLVLDRCPASRASLP